MFDSVVFAPIAQLTFDRLLEVVVVCGNWPAQAVAMRVECRPSLFRSGSYTSPVTHSR